MQRTTRGAAEIRKPLCCFTATDTVTDHCIIDWRHSGLLRSATAGGIDYNTFMKTKKNLIIVGDRVLVDVDARAERTSTGLYLPPTVKEKEKVQAGYVVKVGPGYPVHDPNAVLEEPWSQSTRQDLKYVPLQAVEGDYAIFLRDAAIEIEFEGKKYLIVPHSAILALVRLDLVEDTREDPNGR